MGSKASKVVKRNQAHIFSWFLFLRIRDTGFEGKTVVGPFFVCEGKNNSLPFFFLRVKSEIRTTKSTGYQTKEEGLLKSLIKGHKKKVVKKIKHVSLLVSLVLRRRDTKLRKTVVGPFFVCFLCPLSSILISLPC